MQDLRKFEAESRKFNNKEDEISRKITAKKNELLDFQSNSMNKQKTIDQVKMLVSQKKAMLTKEKEMETSTIQKKAQLIKDIDQAKSDLAKIESEIKQNEELQK